MFKANVVVSEGNSTRATIMAIISVFVLMASLIITVVSDCSPLKEGDTRDLTCSVNPTGCFGPPLTWRVRDTNGGDVTFACSTSSCGNPYPDDVSVTISGSGSTYTSTLTVKADRTGPVDFTSPWRCQTCTNGGSTSTVCDGIEIYALPENPTCTVTRVPDLDEFSSLLVTCSTDKVYPQAQCNLYQTKDGGSPVMLLGTGDYTHPEVPGSPVYYSSTCSQNVAVSSLQEGAYTFTGRMYPGLTGGESLPGLVDTVAPGPGFTLALPSAPTHQCTPENKDGYFKGRSATCTCSLPPGGQGNPKGRPQWYLGNSVAGSQLPDDSAALTVTTSDANQEFKCDGVSNLDRTTGTTLTPKFAYLDDNSVEITSTTTVVHLCGGAIQGPTVTCQVLKTKVNPAPSFSFSPNGHNPWTTQPGTDSGQYYQAQYTPDQPTDGGIYQVTCRVENTIFSDLLQSKPIPIEYRKPPSFYPVVTIANQVYQGSGQTVSLTAGYTGDFTCRVDGGAPSGATDTRLQCGSGLLDVTGPGNTVTGTITSLTRDMDEVVCSCTADHNSGCYDKETTFTLDVAYVPIVTISDVSQPTYSVGDSYTLTCSTQGNPPPSLTLTRWRTGQVLDTRVEGGTKLKQLTHQFSLTCLDTGVYVCAAENNQGTVTRETEIYVECPLYLSNARTSLVVDAHIGQNKEFTIDIYGFPAPTSISFRNINGVNVTTSTRHSVKYTPSHSQISHGTLNVNIRGVKAEDFTDYVIMVDNGVGDALIYTFNLNEDPDTATSDEDASDEDNSLKIAIIVVSVISLLIIAILVVALVCVLRRQREPKQAPPFPVTEMTLPDADYLYPVDSGPDLESNGSRLNTSSPAQGHYETIPDPDTTPGPYDSTSDLGREAPNLYGRMKVRPSSYANVASGASTPTGNYANVISGASTPTANP